MSQVFKPKPYRLYAVHVLTILKKPLNKYIHVGVKKYYQDDGILYIEEEPTALRPRILFQYDMSHVKEIRVREIIEKKYW